MTSLIHGQYNERQYEVLIQHVTPDGEIWEEVYRRPAADLGSPRINPNQMRKYCRKTCREVAKERGLNIGQVMYLPFFDREGNESPVPEGHECW